MLGLTSRWIDVAPGKLHIYDSLAPHDARNPPLVLIHGMCTTGQSMALLGLLLARHSRRIIVIDLIGFDFGFSATSPGTPRNPSIMQHVDWVPLLLDAIQLNIGCTQLDLCGHSFG